MIARWWALTQHPRARAVAWVSLAVAYGLFAFVVGASTALSATLGIFSLAFLAGVPFTVGYVTVFTLHEPRMATRILAPWVPIGAILAICLVARWEGAICVWMASPFLFVFSSAGGVVAGARNERKHRELFGIVVAALPFIAGPVEHGRSQPVVVAVG